MHANAGSRRTGRRCAGIRLHARKLACHGHSLTVGESAPTRARSYRGNLLHDRLGTTETCHEQRTRGCDRGGVHPYLPCMVGGARTATPTFACVRVASPSVQDSLHRAVRADPSRARWRKTRDRTALACANSGSGAGTANRPLETLAPSDVAVQRPLLSNELADAVPLVGTPRRTVPWCMNGYSRRSLGLPRPMHLYFFGPAPSTTVPKLYTKTHKQAVSVSRVVQRASVGSLPAAILFFPPSRFCQAAVSGTPRCEPSFSRPALLADVGRV